MVLVSPSGPEPMPDVALYGSEDRIGLLPELTRCCLLGLVHRKTGFATGCVKTQFLV